MKHFIKRSILSMFILAISLILMGCAAGLGPFQIEPGLQKCVCIKMKSGSLMAGPISFTGKGIVYVSRKDSFCAEPAAICPTLEETEEEASSQDDTGGS